MKTDTSHGNTFILRSYTVAELAEIYEISVPTMRKWLLPFKSEIGVRPGHAYNPKQVQLIIDRLGVPSTIQII